MFHRFVNYCLTSSSELLLCQDVSSEIGVMRSPGSLNSKGISLYFVREVLTERRALDDIDLISSVPGKQESFKGKEVFCFYLKMSIIGYVMRYFNVKKNFRILNEILSCDNNNANKNYEITATECVKF